MSCGDYGIPCIGSMGRPSLSTYKELKAEAKLQSETGTVMKVLLDADKIKRKYVIYKNQSIKIEAI